MIDHSENKKSEPTLDELEEILRRVDRLPILDGRTTEQLLEYDEHGLAR